MDTKINLCDTCNQKFGECKNRKSPLQNSKPVFGDGVGNDNVYKCDSYHSEVGLPNRCPYCECRFVTIKDGRIVCMGCGWNDVYTER